MKFRATSTTTAEEASSAAAEAEEWSVEWRMRRLFQTASARRRRRVYVDAKKRRIERLVWPGLVTSGLKDLRLTDDVVTERRSARHPTPQLEAVSSYRQVRSIRSIGVGAQPTLGHKTFLPEKKGWRTDAPPDTCPPPGHMPPGTNAPSDKRPPRTDAPQDKCPPPPG